MPESEKVRCYDKKVLKKIGYLLQRKFGCNVRFRVVEINDDNASVEVYKPFECWTSIKLREKGED